MRRSGRLRWARCYHDALRHIAEGDRLLAEYELEEAIGLVEAASPGDDRLGCSLFALAHLCQLERRYDEALRLYERALAAETAAFGEDHPFTRSVADALTGLRKRLGRAAEPALA